MTSTQITIVRQALNHIDAMISKIDGFTDETVSTQVTAIATASTTIRTYVDAITEFDSEVA